MKTVFITGGTGYMGTRLIKKLLAGGYRVIALVRPGSENKVPAGCEIVSGDAFNENSFSDKIPSGATFVQLLGVSHPDPSKKELFRKIDLASVMASARAASKARAAHFVYVSVAQEPTKIMHEYQEVRAEGEQCIIDNGLNYTFIRPWYVVGPGHWWPLLLAPFYLLGYLFPASRNKAKKLGLVYLSQMLDILYYAIDNKSPARRIFDVEDIRNFKARK